MTRFSSAVALSILGYGFAYGCQQPAEDDDDPMASGSATTSGIDTNTSSGGTSGNAANGSGNMTSATGGSSSNSTSGGQIPLEEYCEDLAAGLDCGAGSQSAQPKPVNMLIVLDKSGSMAQESNGQEKWSAMKSALASALTGAQNAINFGLELYPTPNLNNDVIDKVACGQAGNCCEMPTHGDMNVPVGSGAEAVNMIIETLDATDPGGGTPTTRAIERAHEYFTSGAGANLEGDKFVLLATDGGPNCNAELTCGADLCTYNLDDESRDCSAQSEENNCCEGLGEGCVDAANVVDRIENLADAGIPTFVVGIPGSEAYSVFLDDFAEAGGRPASTGDNSYYRVDDVAELADVFEAITIQLVNSCEITLPQTTTVAPRIIIECDEIPRTGSTGAAGAGNAGGDTNWEWENGSDTVVLTGEACERVQQGVQRIDVVLDCPPVF